MKRHLLSALLASGCVLAAGGASIQAAQAADPAIPVLADAIGGVVASAQGPEAGVWVIAETTDTPTRLIKEVVADDQGRYLLPQLPKAKFKVWVRGYGLVDSKPVDASPGRSLNLTAVTAPDARAAAQYYPANYWLALIHPPAAGEFPGTGASGNGIAPVMKTQQDWLAHLKDRCMVCHQQGDRATRELADNTVEGWGKRIEMARPAGDQTIGNHGTGVSADMQNGMATFGRDRGLRMFADWTQRIAKGEYPTEAPPRPTGVERNVVLTLWDWGHGRAMHDEIASDRRNPTVNAGGTIFAVAPTTGHIETLDPVHNSVDEFPLPGLTGKVDMDVYPHNPMMDQKGRLWVTDFGHYTLPPVAAGTSQAQRADFCSAADLDKFAKYFPMGGSRRDQEILMFDPATKKITNIPTCFGIHHLGFGRDGDNTLYFSGDTNVIGWIDTKTWDDTHDQQKSEGWCPMVLDTKERGATKVALGDDDVKITPDRTQWNEPGKPQDPKKDTRIGGFLYAMDISAKDGSVWFAKTAPTVPTGIVRFERGSNPPETCHTEYYEPPKLADGTYAAFLGRGVSLDSKGIAWVAFGSGQFASFDRSKCKVMTGPTATGQQCPEGWKLYPIPGPKIAGTDITSDWHYLSWVDLYDTLGLGKDVPIAPGTDSDSLVALMPDTGKILRIRVPYPMGFHGRGMDGRIDDPKAGWKGKGLWALYGMTPEWHQEGGIDGEGPEIVHIQLRPGPLSP